MLRFYTGYTRERLTPKALMFYFCHLCRLSGCPLFFTKLARRHRQSRECRSSARRRASRGCRHCCAPLSAGDARVAPRRSTCRGRARSSSRTRRLWRSRRGRTCLKTCVQTRLRALSLSTSSCAGYHHRTSSSRTRRLSQRRWASMYPQTCAPARLRVLNSSISRSSGNHHRRSSWRSSRSWRSRLRSTRPITPASAQQAPRTTPCTRHAHATPIPRAAFLTATRAYSLRTVHVLLATNCRRQRIHQRDAPRGRRHRGVQRQSSSDGPGPSEEPAFARAAAVCCRLGTS